MDGFYVAKLKKFSNVIPEPYKDEDDEETEINEAKPSENGDADSTVQTEIQTKPAVKRPAPSDTKQPQKKKIATDNDSENTKEMEKSDVKAKKKNKKKKNKLFSS